MLAGWPIRMPALTHGKRLKKKPECSKPGVDLLTFLKVIFDIQLFKTYLVITSSWPLWGIPTVSCF